MMGVFVQLNEDSHKAKGRPIGYVIQENGCWNWVGAISRKGYGEWGINGAARRAHRVMYEREKGAIPPGLQLDHLCRNRSCVNPDHLEPVTNRENSLRGKTATKTHCKHGHAFTVENTIRSRGKTGNPRRRCRTCDIPIQARKNALYASGYVRKYRAKLAALGVKRLSDLKGNLPH